MGNVFAKRGFSRQAASEYLQAQQLFTRQLKNDPNNSDWQRDLSVSYNKLGDMHKVNGYSAKAIQAYQAGLKIAELLAKRDLNRVGWQRDLVVSYVKLSQTIPGKREHYLQLATFDCSASGQRKTDCIPVTTG